jgi:hypothetical protein
VANWSFSRRAKKGRPSLNLEKNLEKRIAALESRMRPDSAILDFADGSTKEIHGPRGFLVKLFAGLSGGALDPEQAEQFELVRRCIRAEEPGGGPDRHAEGFDARGCRWTAGSLNPGVFRYGCLRTEGKRRRHTKLHGVDWRRAPDPNLG